jgi:hypothetical protein
MLLTIMAIIGKHQELPRERWKLYDHAATVLIQHWDVNKHLKDESIEADFIGEDDKKELLRRLAFRMQGSDGGLAGNYIHQENLQAEFESYLIDRYSQTLPQAKVIANAMIQQFRERNFILSLYGANIYGFVHRAFLEYFCAWAFVWKFEKSKELSIEQLQTEVYGKHWKEESWHEVLRLICGMVDEVWAGEIISYLVDEDFESWRVQIRRQVPWNIALAMQSLAEIRNISAVEFVAKEVLNAVFSVIEFESSDQLASVSDVNKHLNFIQDTIDSSIEPMSLLWQPKKQILDWINRLPPLRYSHIHAKTIGQLVGKLAGGHKPVHNTLTKTIIKKNEMYRVFVPYALAIGWINDPDTLPLLRERAVKDEHEFVRIAAVQALR